MYLGHVFGDSHQLRHGTKGVAHEVHVQARNDDAHALVGQLLAYIRLLIVKELRFVDADDVLVGGV